MDMSQNSRWVDDAKISARTAEIYDEVLAGRVALAQESDGLPAQFYIASVYAEDESGEFLVVSFAAPVASLFYKGRSSSDQAAKSLRGIRTIESVGNDPVRLVDSLEVEEKTEVVFPLGSTAGLAIPAPNRKVRRPPEIASIPATPEISDDSEKSQTQDLIHEEGSPDLSPFVADEEPIVEGLRAGTAVLDAINRPRTGKLGSLLSTLQEDQYDLVTWSSQLPLIVQGNPGTGKTVIAMHRAAYLTHPDHNSGERPAESLPLKRVLVIGPTSEYVSHVREVHQQIGGGHVEIVNVADLLARMSRQSTTSDSFQFEPDHRIGTLWEIGSILEKFVPEVFKALPAKDKNIEQLARRFFVDEKLQDRISQHPNHISREFADWLRENSWGRAKVSTAFLPFLASVGLAQNKVSVRDQFDHIIVDESQDISPLVWRCILKLRKPSASISLFGDMNQRRSDFTYDSWNDLATNLELTDDDGVAPIRSLNIVYRSTRQILAFAGQLLGNSEQHSTALREGVPPRIMRTNNANLIADVAKEVAANGAKFPQSVNAVIAPHDDKERVADELRRGGWIFNSRTRYREKDGMKVAVLEPDEARGLEFDAVVVVDPGRFPQNVGRDGVLYTSLTRANQELVVVHSQSLPKNLRPPKSS
jgi:DNA helicase IV